MEPSPAAGYGAPDPHATSVLDKLPPGLINSGNSCYMNSMLQTLASSPRFCAFVTERAEALQYGMARIQAGVAASYSSAPQQQRRVRCCNELPSELTSTISAAAAEGRRTDPQVWGKKVVSAAAGAVDLASAAMTPLVHLVLCGLSRAALWLQGWEPPPAPRGQQFVTRVQAAQKIRNPRAVLPPLVAATCTPLNTAKPRRSGTEAAVAAPPSPLHILAKAPLLQRLYSILQQLQPCYCSTAAALPLRRAQCTGPVDASALMAALRSNLPGGTLEAGAQNDAAEALACLCDCLDAELTAWYLLYGRWMDMPVRTLALNTPAAPEVVGGADASVTAELTLAAPAPSRPTAEAMPWTSASAANGLANVLQSAVPAAQASPGPKDAPGKLTTPPPPPALPEGHAGGLTCRGCLQGARSDQPNDQAVGENCSSRLDAATAVHVCGLGGAAAALSALFRSAIAGPRLPPASPLRGLLSAATTCCVCGGRSVVQVEPFWSLQLPLPPPGAALSGTADTAGTPRGTPPCRPLNLAFTGGPLAAGAGPTAAALWQPLLRPSLCPNAAGAMAVCPPPQKQDQQPQQSRPSAPTAGGHLGGRVGTAPGRGLTLRDCLVQAIQPEVVEDVECCRCSLRAALRRARAAAGVQRPLGFINSAPVAASPLCDSGGSAVPPPISELQADHPAPSNGANGSSLGRAAIGSGTGSGGWFAQEARGGRRCCGTDAQPASEQPSGCVAEGGQGPPSQMAVAPDEAMPAAASSATASTDAAITAAAGPEVRVEPEEMEAGAVEAVGAVGTPSTNLERQLERLKALLSAPHLPELDLELELSSLAALLQPQQQCLQKGRCHIAAAAASNGSTPAPTSPTTLDAAISPPAEPLVLAPVRTRVLRRTNVVRWPQVLVLQLMRTVWDPRVGAAVKDGRRVAFPPVLGPGELEHLGEVPPQSHPGEAGTKEEEEGMSAAPLRPYVLMAVVVHYGGADSGHYLMYRRVVAAAPKVGRSMGPGTDLLGGSSSWLRVSDSSVSMADEQEVLQQAAAVLLYEQPYSGPTAII